MKFSLYRLVSMVLALLCVSPLALAQDEGGEDDDFKLEPEVINSLA